MTTASDPSSNEQPRETQHWAQHVTTLKVGQTPRGAVNLNVVGRRVVGPLQGFGPMWQKTYKVRLAGTQATPTEVIAVWKERFPTFWPKGNRFYAPITGITPGEVALLNLKVGAMPLSTGVLVLYADDESFTLMTPQGHMFAGWITFSAYEEECAIAQASVLMRANDPIYELGLRMGGHRKEDHFWQHTLRSLAAHFGVTDQPVETQNTCVDPKLQWSHARNVWQNAAMRTTLTAPARWFRRR